MKITSALIGIAALGGVALSSGAASAMPVTAPAQTSSVVVPAGYVCNEWGHCWHRHSYGYGHGYYHPDTWGGWVWRHRYWHHSWYHWHRLHSWNTGY
jgi:hypothetical protein